MDEQELLKERFKSAVSSALKAIAEDYDIEIKFGNNTNTKKNSLNLPEIANLKKLQEFAKLQKTPKRIIQLQCLYYRKPPHHLRIKLLIRKP